MPPPAPTAPAQPNAATPGAPQPGLRPDQRPAAPGAIAPAPQPGAQPTQRPLPPLGAPTQPNAATPGATQPGARPDQRPVPPNPPAVPGQPSTPAQPGAVPPAAAPVQGQPNPAVPPGAAPGAAVPGRPGVAPPAPGAVQGQPPAGLPGQLPGQPPQREGRRGGISPGVAGAIGLGAGVIGGIMATQGAERFDDIRRERQEQREGDLTIIREPGRTIIRDDDGRAIIRRDEDQRFRDLGWQGRAERRDGETRTVFERPDGTRIVTVTDEEGRLIRRSRIGRDDREVIIIDNTLRDRPGRFADDVVVLPPPPLPIPRERYIVNADQADESLIYETIMAPPIAAIPRRYTLDEVRYSPDLRARMRSVDIDTINFETGSWQVTADQAQRLAVIADSVRRVLQGSPNEVFLVEGHTDAVGSDIDNLSLSDRRAQSVAEILTRDFQIPPENLTTQGYGEQYLKVQTQAASRENRRVTLRRITPLLTGQSR
ncbi:outer membrane protein OmpA-like peptidoglycan-associated protein [Bosea sp. OAE752]|uniref:OmpA family protein n=1 Tax=Bosea sp. RCC_152_1 TaxID=3239228 RepID=UPI0035233E0A